MNVKDAELLAKEFLQSINQYCERMEITGSIRRRKEYPSKIEVIVIPKSRTIYDFMAKLRTLKYTGKLMQSMIVEYKGTSIEVNVSSQDRWYVDLFVTTGSGKFIKKTMDALKSKGYSLLTSSGKIVNDNKKEQLINNEEAIFIISGIPYTEPWDREGGNLSAPPSLSSTIEDQDFV